MNKKGFRKYIPILCFALIAALLVYIPLTAKSENTEEVKPSILTVAAERRDIEVNIYAGGPLSAAEAESVSIPAGVEITEYLVHNGDMVSKGDVIATADKLSVMSAVTGVQSALDELNSEIEIYWHTGLGTYTANADGQIFINENEADSYALANSSELASYIEQHNQYEELMLKLFLLYQNGTVTAPSAGMIDGLDASAVDIFSMRGGRISLLAVNTPYGDDEISYQNYVGIVDSVSEEGIGMRMNPTPFPVEDYLDLSGVSTDISAMTEPGTFAGTAPIFVYADGAWTQLGADTLKSGDLLIFAFDEAGNPVWIVKINTPDPPDEPGGDDDGGDDGPGGGSGGYGGMTGEQPQEETLYRTDERVLCSVVPMDEMSITATVDEQDVPALSIGKTVTVTFNALPGQSFEGTITEISKVGDNNGGSSKFEFIVTLPYSENMLPGMNASVIISLDCVKNALSVPVAAICEDDGKSFVYLGYDEKEECLTEPAEIETGSSDGEYVEVLSGISEGQQLRYEYYDTLPIEFTAPAAPGGFRFGFGRRR